MIRALGLALALLILAACERQGAREPFIESRAPAGLAAHFLPPEGWAWGLIKVADDPGQRYGVASPPRAPLGEIVIVPGYGEVVEIWFEVVRDLEAAGFTVWVLDRAGQGGSGRFTGPRDLGHVPSFDPDVRALNALIHHVARPSSDRPTTILAQSDGAVVALLAVGAGMKADGLVLNAPRFATPGAEDRLARLDRWLKLDRSPPRGWRPWRRPDTAIDSQPPRARVGPAWALANPDLRMSGPSRGWMRAFRSASEHAVAELPAIDTNVLVMGAQPAVSICQAAPKCRFAATGIGDTSPYLLDDLARARWLSAVSSFALAPTGLGDLSSAP